MAKRHGIEGLTWGGALVGTAAVLASSAPYLVPGLGHPFLQERPELTVSLPWRLSLVIHVAAGMVCLPLGLYLLLQRAALRRPGLHRLLGRAYVYSLIAVLFPSGVYLSWHAKGGGAAVAGFLLSNALALYFTCTSVLAVRRRDLILHRAQAIRGYAQVASAITFRVYHLALQLVGLPYELNYVSSLWLSVAGNALIAEGLIRSSHPLPERNPYEDPALIRRSVTPGP